MGAPSWGHPSFLGNCFQLLPRQARGGSHQARTCFLFQLLSTGSLGPGGFEDDFLGNQYLSLQGGPVRPSSLRLPLVPVSASMLCISVSSEFLVPWLFFVCLFSSAAVHFDSVESHLCGAQGGRRAVGSDRHLARTSPGFFVSPVLHTQRCQGLFRGRVTCPFPGRSAEMEVVSPGEAAAHRPAPGRFHPPRAHVAVRLSGTKPADGLRPVPGRRVLAHRSRQALVTAAVNIHLSPTPRLPVSFTVILCWCFRGPGPPTCGPAQNRTFT